MGEIMPVTRRPSPAPRAPASATATATADSCDCPTAGLPLANLDPDPLNLAPAFMEAGARMLMNPATLVGNQIGAWHRYVDLWHSGARSFLGLDSRTVAEPDSDDTRFTDPAWDENRFFDLLKQHYLIASEAIVGSVEQVEGLDPKTAQKVSFFTRQFVDAMAPTNFAMTNPSVLRATIESNGGNLLRGLNNLARDLSESDGQLRVSMTDKSAFRLGSNVATTPGQVIFQNEMMQLLQYSPSTETVFERPLLIVPPWINKYYILDLQPKNSMIKWLVEQGHTVFVISWVNPGPALAAKSFDDYLRDGTIAALDAIEQACGEHRVNAIGYCLGGTLLAATMAYLESAGDPRIASGTFFTTMIDFAEPGELGVFIDEAQIEQLERRMRNDGYLDGSAMSSTFNMLRANDLVWSFVIHNYLLGNEPFAFDLLYWNSDSTRMPADMHSFYLRKMYLENRLCEPGGIELDGVPIDMGRIRAPAYFLSTQEDHIAPWQSTYAGARLFSGPVRFVLGESGHIAGVINPPARGKYGYRLNGARTLPDDAEGWLRNSRRHQGSWWPDWQRWVKRHAGKRVAQRRPGDGRLPALEAAPGSYVRVRLDNGDC